MDTTLQYIGCRANIVTVKIKKTTVMQFLEITLLFSTFFYLISRVFFNVQIKKKYVLSILILILLAHLFIEGCRWQMMPAYLLWIFAIITAIKTSDKRSSIVGMIFKGIGLLVLGVLGFVFPSIFPVFDLPEPSGKYTVSTTDIFLELDRDEVITTNPDDKRKLMIKAWYPSEEKEGIKDPYIDQGGRHGFAQKYGLPDATFNYLDKIETHVFRDLAIAKKQFPVLIFSHGYNSKANNYYALISEIVSHGYVVFALNHTYESTGTTFPDGEEVYFDYEYAQKIEAGTWEDMKKVIESFHDGSSFEARHPVVKEGLETYFVKDMVEGWAQDIYDVTDHLAQWNTNGFFKDRLDLSNTGVFGHSRGGGAAGEALLTDNRLKAGANIDGVQWGKIVDTSFTDPFLYISADWPASKEDLNAHAYINKSQSVFYEARVLKTLHSNFMDIPFMIPFQSLSEAGDIDPEMGIEITSKLVTSFFDKHLKNKDIDVKALDEKYELLNLTIYEKE